ncbi:DUF459 domain-containing protein [Xanthobacteraceae bacterium Astr-EGSB]|uniref:SGNH/GDSL hydrolase family protein n=1 Tax=Astrobacterium formosum TaxID=3069710 RepID=UPI0027AF4B2F|nr:DUF459 domain-containing protein [Xanthobacteraceae bacterium Astr-EGSB]
MTRGTGMRITVLGLLAAAVGAAAMLAGPASAQWFDDRFPGQRQRSWFAPWGQPAQPAEPPKPVDYSRAPAPKKSDVVPQTHVVVMGDAMADWLAYGLELAAAESPDIGITRKHKTISGLIRTEVKKDPRGDHPDWPQAARDILAAEPANFVVFMAGLNDRKSIREAVAAKKPAEPAKDASKTAAKPAAPAKPGDDTQDDAEQTSADAPAAIAEPEPARPGTTTSHEFRSDRWVELYTKRVDDTIAALKSKNVPVFWIGLPPIRGTRSSSDAGFLNELYRSRAEKAGITYIDVWDGFVDEAGRYVNFGPDFEGQRRRLRSDDGVYFTKAGARKLAHYVEREIQRAMVTQATPVALPLPDEPTTPQTPARGAPGVTVRPLAGPVMPLTTSRDSDELLGAGTPRQSITDATASKVLVKGEAVAAPAGRSDDFAWPRRDIAPVGSDPVVATTTLPMTPMLPEKPVVVAATPASEPAKARTAAAPSHAAAARPRPSAQQQAQQREREQREQRAQSRPFFFPFFSRW